MFDELMRIETAEKTKQGENVYLRFSKNQTVRIDGEEISLLEGYNKYVRPFFKASNNTQVAIKLIALAKRAAQLEAQKKPKQQ